MVLSSFYSTVYELIIVIWLCPRIASNKEPQCCILIRGETMPSISETEKKERKTNIDHWVGAWFSTPKIIILDGQIWMSGMRGISIINHIFLIDDYPRWEGLMAQLKDVCPLFSTFVAIHVGWFHNVFLRVALRPHLPKCGRANSIYLWTVCRYESISELRH